MLCKGNQSVQYSFIQNHSFIRDLSFIHFGDATVTGCWTKAHRTKAHRKVEKWTKLTSEYVVTEKLIN